MLGMEPQEVEKNTQCFSRIPPALKQNRAQARLLYFSTNVTS